MAKGPKEEFHTYHVDPALDVQRWRDNKIAQLREGYTLTPLGRALALFYRRGKQVIEFPSEISGTPDFDIVIFIPEKGLAWIDTATYEQTPLSAAEMQAQLAALKTWLIDRGMRPSM
jgi:hypothetical protein